jgi:hypothetical protein
MDLGFQSKMHYENALACNILISNVVNIQGKSEVDKTDSYRI